MGRWVGCFIGILEASRAYRDELGLVTRNDVVQSVFVGIVHGVRADLGFQPPSTVGIHVPAGHWTVLVSRLSGFDLHTNHTRRAFP